MKRCALKNQTASITVALLAVAFPACATRVGSISLMDPTGTCVFQGPKTIEVHVKKGKSGDLEETRGVAWVVSNLCAKGSGEVRRVDVYDFKQDGAAADPLTCPTGKYVKLEAGQIGVIACKVTSTAKGKYSYKVKIDDVLMKDPDVIIKRY